MCPWKQRVYKVQAPRASQAVHANRAPSVASLCGSSHPRLLSGAFQRKCLRWSVPERSVSTSPWHAECGGTVQDPAAQCHMVTCSLGLAVLQNVKRSGQLAQAARFSFSKSGKLLGAVLENQDHSCPTSTPGPPHGPRFCCCNISMSHLIILAFQFLLSFLSFSLFFFFLPRHFVWTGCIQEGHKHFHRITFL